MGVRKTGTVIPEKREQGGELRPPQAFCLGVTPAAGQGGETSAEVAQMDLNWRRLRRPEPTAQMSWALPESPPGAHQLNT